MRSIEPDMVLGKDAIDHAGGVLGEIVDVGLYAHDRVKFLVVQEVSASTSLRPGLINVGVDAIASVSDDSVRLSLV